MDRRPNIVVIITDQERSHRHWPKGWAEQNLRVHYDRLIGCKADNGGDRSSAVFTNAFTATTECSPSRASLLTSSYPTEHGVVTTPGVLDPISDRGISSNNNEDAPIIASERSQRPNLLRLLSAQPTKSADTKGYNVSWKGKWHLFHSNDPTILNYYGATSPWNPPDAGHSLSVSYTLGGGMKYNHDGRFLRGTKRKFDVLLKQQQSVDVGLEIISSDSDESREETETESVFDFLSKQKLDKDGSRTQPFCLIASLVNPHDVWASSRFSELSDEEFYRETGYHPRDFESIPIDLPPSRNDDLQSKPSIQSLMRSHPVFGDLSDSNNDDDDQPRKSDALRYVRFYAYLHKLVDDEIGSLLDELKATGQMDNTIIIRMADHGELGLSHAMR
jgi:choline-sulfatase